MQTYHVDPVAGLGILPDGQNFIKGWPTKRKHLHVGNAEPQTLAEAATWCEKARVACEWGVFISMLGITLVPVVACP